MRTFRNLSYALLLLTIFSLILIFPFTQATSSMTVFTLLGVFIAVFAVSLVALIASLLMYFNSKTNNIIVLKRRGARVYAELLHQKLRLITAMDGDKHVSDWLDYLYDQDNFPRITKFLGEEYFLLLSCDSFAPNSEAAQAYNAFRSLHDELHAYIRSVNYDRTECFKFKKLYRVKTGYDMTVGTDVREFEQEVFAESYEALQMANEVALNTIENLLVKIEQLEVRMDNCYEEGTDWKTTKKNVDARYQVWLHDTEA